MMNITTDYNLTYEGFNLSLLFPYFFSFSRSLHIALSVVGILIMVFIALANGIIIIALIISIRRERHRETNIITKILMTSMAITDACLALAVLPLAIHEIFQNDLPCIENKWCFAKIILDPVLCTVSVSHVAAMAFDRYLSVCRPLVYRKMTNKTGYILISVAWILPSAAIVINILTYLLHGTQGLVTRLEEPVTDCLFDLNTRLQGVMTIILTVYVPFLVIFILYFLILREVGRFHRRRSQFQARSTPQQDKNLHGSSAALVLSEISVVDKVQHSKTDSRQTQDISSRPPDTFMHDINVLTTSQVTLWPGTISGTTQTQSNRSTNSCHSNDLCSESSSRDGAPAVEGQGHSCEQSRVADTKQTNTTGNSTRPIQQNKMVSLKAVRTVGSIVICFTLCWLPFAIFEIVQYYVSIPSCPVVQFSLSWLTYLNSALNPLVYCSHRSIRKAVRDLICFRNLCCRS